MPNLIKRTRPEKRRIKEERQAKWKKYDPKIIQKFKDEIINANRNYFFENFDLDIGNLRIKGDKIPPFALLDVITRSKICLELSNKGIIVAKQTNDQRLMKDAQSRLKDAKWALIESNKIIGQRKKAQAKKAG